MVTEAVALAVGGAFLSSFLNVLFDRLATVQAIDLFRATKVKADLLRKTEMLLLTVQAVLDDAEEKQSMNPYVKKWVDKLKDAAYDAEDLLDVIAIEDPSPAQVKDYNTRLEHIVQQLDHIAAEKHILSLCEGQGRKSLRRLPTTCLVDESEECFRNDDKMHILDVLLSYDVDGPEIPVIAIVGIGGIGKTTLAQFLYNDNRVKNYFDFKAWVYVSEEFDVFKVTKTIYEFATFSRSNVEDLNVLQLELQMKLMGKRFLLVLDDVWNECYREWDLLRRSLQVGAPGSKIIVTTRNQSVASTMLPALVHDLKRLSEEDCWLLFSKHAFGNRIPNDDSTLTAIGEKIVEKCKGLPLAIKTLGSLLHSQLEAQEWDNVLNSRIWDLPDHKSDILPALRLSYHYLPSQLKRCFAYCSIFPKGHYFEKGDLVRMWIAEGLVQQPNNRRKKEVSEQYFHELLSRSIFQRSQVGSRFIMHDLVNDLAQYVAGEFCLRFEHDSLPQNPLKVRHSSCIFKPSDKPYKFEAFFGKNNLRTFLPLKSSDNSGTHFNSGVFDKLFPAHSCLRVLSLSPFKITKFPKSVANLKQLRYLDLSGAAIDSLPKRVGYLKNLETLKLSDCHRLNLLPTNLWNLTKLEHLDIKNTPISQMPPNFGNLERLQLLTNFVVGNNKGSTISELEHLSLLQGTLCISQLQYVSQTADAEKANLKDKKDLRELILEWAVEENAAEEPLNHSAQNAAGDPSNRNVQNAANDPQNRDAEEVLDKLQPGENLERLQIKNFCGMSLPSWLGYASFSKMKSITLDNCQNCNSLPPLGQLPSLKELAIHDMAGVRIVGSEFYGGDGVAFKSLEILLFERMDNWEQWLPFTNEQGFPFLCKLLMIGCRRLTGDLPIQLPPWAMHIDDCDRLNVRQGAI